MELHARDLRYFLSVAERRSFTWGAAVAGVSQPALSRQIRLLEERLGTPLFLRGAREVTLTPAGDALVPHAREVLRVLDAAARDVAAARAAAERVVIVGFSTAVGRGLLPAAIDRLEQTQQGWQIRPRHVPWDDPSAGLDDGSSDVAIVWLPLPVPERYAVHVVATEPRWVALPVEHRLAGRDRLVLSDLADEAFLALPERAGPLRDHWLAADQRAGTPVRVGGVVRTAEEAFEQVAGGAGVVLLSSGNAGLYAHPGVVMRPVDGAGTSTLAVVRRRDDARPAVREVVAALVRAAHAGGASPAPAPVPSPPGTRAAAGVTAAGVAPQPLTIAVSGYTDAVQQRVLALAARTQPPVPVLLRSSDSTSSRVAAVTAGDVDAAFVRVSRRPDASLALRVLSTEPLLAAVPVAHQLAAGPPVLPLARLDGVELAFYHREQNPWWYDEILSGLADHGARTRIVHRGLWAFDALSQVAAGRAVALVSATVAADARLEGVVYRRLSPPVLTATMALLWRREDVSPSLAGLLDELDRTEPRAG